MKLTKKQIDNPSERQRQIIEAMKWFGFELNREFDVCENGAVFIGLTEILPKS